jgi:hypothetical protein
MFKKCTKSVKIKIKGDLYEKSSACLQEEKKEGMKTSRGLK